MPEFRALSARTDETAGLEYDVLHEGVPTWLESSAVEWTRKCLIRDGVVGSVDEASLRNIERIARVRFEWHDNSYRTLREALERFVTDSVLFLDAIDYLLSTVSWRNPQGRTKGNDLDRMLEDAGSAWRVVLRDDGHHALERRVVPELVSAFERVTKDAGRPAAYLRQAWVRAYSRESNPDGAYRDAVRAMEAGLKPVVSPENRFTTLGTVIRDIEAKPEKFALALSPSSGTAVDKFIEMLRLVWTAQLDRHGTDDESIPLKVTIEEARAAVACAITICSWVRDGYFRRA